MIEIWVDAAQPPAGRVVVAPGDEPRAFAGWIDLLRILADAIAAEGTAPKE